MNAYTRREILSKAGGGMGMLALAPATMAADTSTAEKTALFSGTARRVYRL